MLKSPGLAALFTVAALALTAGSRAAAADDPNDRGVFVLRLAGKQIGTESFEINSQKGAIEATAKIEMRLQQEGKTSEFKTSPRLVLSPELRPQTYEWSQKGAQSSNLEIDMRSTPLKAKYHTVSGEEDMREFQLPPDLVILDNNVIHHYQIAVMQFRKAGGGKQSFRTFVPQEALPAALQIEAVGTERTDIGGREQLLEHLVMTTDNAPIDLWIDKDGRLQKLAIPAAQLEVVRKK